MKTHEILGIHAALHDPKMQSVLVSDSTLPLGQIPVIVRSDNERLLMARIDLRTRHGHYRCMTQNLRKASPNTEWVLATPNARITWFVRTDVQPNSYVGKVVEYDDSATSDHVLEVWNLRPERLIYSHRTGGGGREALALGP